MPDALSLHQHSAIAEIEAPATQHPSQLMVTASIADDQIGQPPEQFTAACEMTAEGAAPVVDECD